MPVPERRSALSWPRGGEKWHQAFQNRENEELPCSKRC